MAAGKLGPNVFVFCFVIMQNDDNDSVKSRLGYSGVFQETFCRIHVYECRKLANFGSELGHKIWDGKLQM